MKIAVTSTGNSLGSELDPHFGRAKAFIIYDMESGEFEVVDNSQNLNAAQGAGIQAAENVSRLGVECLITGNCGPNAFRTLQAADIKVMLCPGGTVEEAIQKLNSGELDQAERPTVAGHGA